MTSEQLNGWKAFYRIEPFGQDNLQRAVIAHTVAKPHLPKSSKIEIEDFMVGYVPLLKKAIPIGILMKQAEQFFGPMKDKKFKIDKSIRKKKRLARIARLKAKGKR